MPFIPENQNLPRKAKAQKIKLLFASPDLKIILRNTLGYNLAFVFLNAAIPLALSIALSQLRNKRTSKVYQTIIMLPHFISYIVITYIVYAFLSFKYVPIIFIFLSIVV